MKINFIIPFKRMSGGIRIVYTYANYLVSQGHEVCCYLPAVSYKGKGQSFFFRAKASFSNMIKPESWFECKFPVRVVPAITDKCIPDADVVVATAWQTAYDVARLNRDKGKKFYFVQDFETFNGEEKDVVGSYKLGIPIITITNALKEQISPYSDDISVVYNGLLESEFIKEKKKNCNFTIMFLYHESEHKGTGTAISVVKEIENRFPETKVIVFGRRIMESLPEKWMQLSNPPRDVLIRAYQEATVYLFTSRKEAWGLPIVEAMANKCAVVGPSLGALSELYNGENAIIANTEDEMVDALIKLRSSISKLEFIQDNGYETAKKLEWNKSFRLFENIICK